MQFMHIIQYNSPINSRNWKRVTMVTCRHISKSYSMKVRFPDLTPPKNSKKRITPQTIYIFELLIHGLDICPSICVPRNLNVESFHFLHITLHVLFTLSIVRLATKRYHHLLRFGQNSAMVRWQRPGPTSVIKELVSISTHCWSAN